MNIDPLNGGYCGMDGFHHSAGGRAQPGIRGMDGISRTHPPGVQAAYCGTDGRYHHPDGSITGPMSMIVPLSLELQTILDKVRLGASPRRGIKLWR